jgi:hypothetical protein
MRIWKTTIEVTQDQRFYLAMTEYEWDYSGDCSVSDVDEPAVSAGRTFATKEAALEFALEHEISVSL